MRQTRKEISQRIGVVAVKDSARWIDVEWGVKDSRFSFFLLGLIAVSFANGLVWPNKEL